MQERPHVLSLSSFRQYDSSLTNAIALYLLVPADGKTSLSLIGDKRTQFPEDLWLPSCTYSPTWLLNHCYVLGVLRKIYLTSLARGTLFPTGFEKLWGGIKPCLSFCHVLPASLCSCVKVYMFAILSWESADVQCRLTLLMNFWQLWSPLAPVLFKSQMDFPRWKRTCSWPHLAPRKLVLNQAHSLCLIWSLWFHPIRCLNSQFFSFLIPMYTWHQKLDKWLQIRWEKNKTLFLKQNLILF